MPTKKTMNRFRLKIQPISDDERSDSWFWEKYDSKTAAEFIKPNSESMAQKEPNTTSQAVRPPSGNSVTVSAAEGHRASGRSKDSGSKGLDLPLGATWRMDGARVSGDSGGLGGVVP
jgi:hypothetical protein